MHPITSMKKLRSGISYHHPKPIKSKLSSSLPSLHWSSHGSRNHFLLSLRKIIRLLIKSQSISRPWAHAVILLLFRFREKFQLNNRPSKARVSLRGIHSCGDQKEKGLLSKQAADPWIKSWSPPSRVCTTSLFYSTLFLKSNSIWIPIRISLSGDLQWKKNHCHKTIFFFFKLTFLKKILLILLFIITNLHYENYIIFLTYTTKLRKFFFFLWRNNVNVLNEYNLISHFIPAWMWYF